MLASINSNKEAPSGKELPNQTQRLHRPWRKKGDRTHLTNKLLVVQRHGTAIISADGCECIAAQHLTRTFSHTFFFCFFAVTTLLSKRRAASIDRSIVRKKRTFQRKTCSILSRTAAYLHLSRLSLVQSPETSHTLLYCTVLHQAVSRSGTRTSTCWNQFECPQGGAKVYIRLGLDLVEGSAEEKSWFYFFFFFFFLEKNEQDKDRSTHTYLRTSVITKARSLITHSTQKEGTIEPNPPN